MTYTRQKNSADSGSPQEVQNKNRSASPLDSFTLLYRGHGHGDYLETKTESGALCFYDQIEKAKLYGLGNNDIGNPDVADGYITTVEFHGEIKSVPYNGEYFVRAQADGFQGSGAVRCRDGVIVVLDRAALKNPQRAKATSC